MPEPKKLSAQVKRTVALLLYQPFDPFGPVVTAAEIVGMVLSIRTKKESLPLLWFPARSVALCEKTIPELLKDWLTGQAATPEPPALSAQVKLTVTGVVLFQPAVGTGFTAAMIVGAVLSILTVITLLGALTFPALSVTVCAVDETDAPSALNIWSAGQAAIPEPPGSAQVKCTVTLLLYQPFDPVPDVTAAEIVGGIVSNKQPTPGIQTLGAVQLVVSRLPL